MISYATLIWEEETHQFLLIWSDLRVSVNEFLRKPEHGGSGCRGEVQGDPTLAAPVVLTGALIPQEMPSVLPPRVGYF